MVIHAISHPIKTMGVSPEKKASNCYSVRQAVK